MKVFIATITSDYNGNVEVGVKPFSTFEKAAKYLHNQYLEIKEQNEQDEDFVYGQDYVNNLSEDSSEEFYMEDEDGQYWCSGYIYGMEVE